MNSQSFDVETILSPIAGEAKLYNFSTMHNIIDAKPFLKWAGGKRQLLEQFKKYFPKELSEQGKIKHFYEPFLGSGAVFFWVAQNYAIENAYLNELNPEIYLCYLSIKKNVEAVIKSLKAYETKYKSCDDKGKEVFFYKIRKVYNLTRKDLTPKTVSEADHKRVAMTIFLNRTCFNGLYRVNSKGDFNVPFGRYRNPKICDAENLRNVAEILQKVEITNADFSVIKDRIKSDSFVYFDPPYKPVSKTASFTAYSSNSFTDEDQKRLALLVRDIDSKTEAKIMLSNSAPKSNFFKNLYAGFKIRKVSATRLINCVAEKRGKVNEILVMNYPKTAKGTALSKERLK